MKTVFTLLMLIILTACGDTTSVIGPKGDKGDPGVQGIPGVNGSNGQDGAQGPQGLPGAPGSTITEVQLCGGCQAAYPSVFPEIGLCIDNKLYGVYSANGGFMVELPPGTYSSNGINCSCTLTVASGCIVSQ